MNGIHDLGGMHGFGPIEREENEPRFHEAWEGVVFAITQIVRNTHHLFNVDEFRRGIETMDPAEYLPASYYERWLRSIALNLIEKGAISADELERRVEELAGQSESMPRETAVRGAAVPAPVDDRPTDAPPPRFAAGDRVVARNLHPRGHTRLPRYVRGKRGVVDRARGAQVFPDTNAHGLGRHPQSVYSVRFTGRELWGESAEASETLYIDLWESYLEPTEGDAEQ
ncbi:MAG: nitrile hydratase subunit beta [Chloroflexota bacterium]